MLNYFRLCKAVDCYFKVPEKISKALASLGDDLKSMETYNRLFGSSLSLEDVFCKSYVDIFRFWSRVFRELLRNSSYKTHPDVHSSLSNDTAFRDHEVHRLFIPPFRQVRFYHRGYAG